MTQLSTRRFKRLWREFRAHCEKYQLPCWLCGRPIDYALRGQHPDAFNLDHAKPVSTYPELAEDRSNFRPSHADCNKRRGNKAPFIAIGRPSERW
ncbi:HNH endonuclease [Mycobacteroides abscessus]|uniref:HNH endonuclease n=1 Tax=Mycobacteroides abscessus TaxID=36809 RepID=UPI0005DFBC3E|nr:HNH endonuclease [Mycobacteroides abscessus]CPR79361.1 HNH endonuclease [Mycobacteroides abscessus]CPV03230.1 HNH endonuclease [Mycobacteroides abscessus]